LSKRFDNPTIPQRKVQYLPLEALLLTPLFAKMQPQGNFGSRGMDMLPTALVRAAVVSEAAASACCEEPS
jgi:hypothetical protein